jgi:adenylate cyclase
LAAILAADIAGYSRLMGADEVGTLKALKAHRRELIDPTIASHHGRIVKTTGDGMLVEFGSAVDAVTCAMIVQTQMLKRNLESAGPRIAFRIGINIGDIIIDDNDIFGDGVNVAARLEGIAEPGGICISSSAYEQVRGKVSVEFTDLGEQRLKNIDRRVRAYAAKSMGHLGTVTPTVPPSHPEANKQLPLPDKPSIAVLPFQNMSGDPEQEYFADGIVEDMITALSRFKSLFVIARNSSFTYKGKAIDIKQIGRELGVRYVLEGSVRKASGRVRITGQLIDAATGTHLWADKFDGALDDIFDLQDKVTASVVGTVAPTIEQAEMERAKQKPTDRLDCYDLYLRGTALMYRRSTLSKAFELLKLAIDKDKEFGAAYATAAFVLLVEQASSGSLLSDDRRNEAVRLAQQAVRLRPDDALVLAQSAHVLCYLGHEYDRAALLSEQAVTLNGNLAPAWHSRGWVTLMCVLPDQAIESFQRMMRLSPLDPLTAGALYGNAFAYFLASRHEAGLAVATRAVQMAPNVHSLGAFIVNAVTLGRAIEAEDAATRLLKIDPNFRVAHTGDLFPTRSLDWQTRIANAFREAGLPP